MVLAKDKGKQWAEIATTRRPPSKFKEKNVLVVDTLAEPKRNPPFQQNTTLYSEYK